MPTATPEQEAFNEIWGHVMSIAENDGVIPLNKHEGLWKRRIDARWSMELNGQRETVDGVPPFSIAVEFNGWPAGIINTNGATLAAGELANIFTLRDALAAVVREFPIPSEAAR